jgi:hypothetical protein
MRKRIETDEADGTTFVERLRSDALRFEQHRSCRARSSRRALASSQASRVVRESCRARSPRRPLASPRKRVVSCAQLTTRSRAATNARTSDVRLADHRALRPSQARPDHTTSILPKHRRPSSTPRVTREARDTRRAYARWKLPRPARARLVSRAKLVTRAATYPERAVSIPVEIEGHRSQVERDATCETLRIRRRRARASAPNLRGFRGACPVRRTRVQAAQSQHAPNTNRTRPSATMAANTNRARPRSRTPITPSTRTAAPKKPRPITPSTNRPRPRSRSAKKKRPLRPTKRAFPPSRRRERHASIVMPNFCRNCRYSGLTANR